MENINYKEMLLYIVEKLVDHPEEIGITELDGEDTLTLQLRVNPDDMGKVIGRQGRIAKGIRTLLKSAGMRENKKIMVDILD